MIFFLWLFSYILVNSHVICLVISLLWKVLGGKKKQNTFFFPISAL